MSPTTNALARDYDLFTFMRASHRAMDRAFERLLDALAANDQLEVHSNWVQVEAELLAHMETEERFVLPAFARVELGHATALLGEHASIRQQLLELGVAVELHFLRLEPCKQFIATLRAHAQREDELLYRWAAGRLDANLVEAATWHLDGLRGKNRQ
ncbi:MAG: hemerythrin domain-containing protein [Deltaproteobacteria bacterium]|nr:hemerythrin domain-containing protein [Deltaproteobacteria bacterium]